jgi:hypothetical protein
MLNQVKRNAVSKAVAAAGTGLSLASSSPVRAASNCDMIAGSRLGGNALVLIRFDG